MASPSHAEPATAYDLIGGREGTMYGHIVNNDAERSVIFVERANHQSAQSDDCAEGTRYSNFHLKNNPGPAYVWSGDWVNNPAIHMTGASNVGDKCRITKPERLSFYVGLCVGWPVAVRQRQCLKAELAQRRPLCRHLQPRL
jgi:hypothetical protein